MLQSVLIEVSNIAISVGDVLARNKLQEVKVTSEGVEQRFSWEDCRLKSAKSSQQPCCSSNVSRRIFLPRRSLTFRQGEEIGERVRDDQENSESNSKHHRGFELLREGEEELNGLDDNYEEAAAVSDDLDKDKDVDEYDREIDDEGVCYVVGDDLGGGGRRRRS
eukprot:763458-Hanusia_phi.AAC.5